MRIICNLPFVHPNLKSLRVFGPLRDIDVRKVGTAVVRFMGAHPLLQRTEFQDYWWLVVVLVEHRMPMLLGEYLHLFQVTSLIFLQTRQLKLPILWSKVMEKLPQNQHPTKKSSPSNHLITSPQSKCFRSSVARRCITNICRSKCRTDINRTMT